MMKRPLLIEPDPSSMRPAQRRRFLGGYSSLHDGELTIFAARPCVMKALGHRAD
jgi:hypothetical protein